MPSTNRPALDLVVLDNPAWHALNGPQARFAQAYGDARRYDPDVAPFHALPDEPTAQAWRDLAALVGPGEVALLNGGTFGEAPADWEPVGGGAGVQLVDVSVDAAPDDDALVLTVADVPEITDLIARAQPGPWRPRTIELGTYLGIRRDGRLVAIAGERQRPPGWTEVSAVATDEEFRGQGLAGRLVRAVVHNIRSRGDHALLHAAGTNLNAIRLYEKLGFELRRHTRFEAFRAPATAPSATQESR